MWPKSPWFQSTMCYYVTVAVQFFCIDSLWMVCPVFLQGRIWCISWSSETAVWSFVYSLNSKNHQHQSLVFLRQKLMLTFHISSSSHNRTWYKSVMKKWTQERMWETDAREVDPKGSIRKIMFYFLCSLLLLVANKQLYDSTSYNVWYKLTNISKISASPLISNNFTGWFIQMNSSSWQKY